MKRVVMFSGGVGSWAAAKRTVEKHGVAEVTLLFADTLIEHPDTYRFLEEAAANVGANLLRVADGRTPHQVFRDRKMLGNTRIAPCSVHLKQIPARRWMAENAPDAAVVLGIDWTEIHRLEPAARGWQPWVVEAPLCEPPYRAKPELLEDLDAAGIERPWLYRAGFPHNNCGGACPRAGIAQWSLLDRVQPRTFTKWIHIEEDLRGYLHADVSILRDRTGGETKPLTLAELRRRLRQQPSFGDGEEWGGCGCFLEESANANAATGSVTPAAAQDE